jgi:prepilin-type N-terminal cleavage/methylation domain-containing protein
MKAQKGFTLTEAIVVLVILVGGWGWIWNIVKLISMNLDPITGLLIVRAIGIFVPPVGAIVGYF